MPDVFVIGAGVSGLTSAYLLSKDDRNHVAVFAKHMPGDMDIEYASPWAGANFVPMSSEPGSCFERGTWPVLRKLATDVPEAGIHLQKCRLYRRKKDQANLHSHKTMLGNVFTVHPWYRDLVDDYRDLRQDERPEGIGCGCEFGSVCVNPVLYLPWLVGQCRANGVMFYRKIFAHISDIRHFSDCGFQTPIIVNATGLSAAKLGDVLDQTMYPIRGQTVVVRNVAPHMVIESGTDGGEDQASYMMTRAVGGGTTLGGTLQVGNWQSQPDLNIANKTIARAVKISPALTGGRGPEHLDVIRHGVGLRPGRVAGVRPVKEKIDGMWIVHNYGHAGWGYQESCGCAEEVVRLVNSIKRDAKL